MRKKITLMAMFMITLIIAAGCGGESTSDDGDAEQVYTLQAGHSLTTDHPYHLGFVELAEQVEERTDGQVVIEIFPNNEIGAERELTEGLSLGTVDFAMSSTAPIVNIVPELEVLDAPFLFEDREAAVEVLNGEIGDELFEAFEKQGIIGLSWAENGFRQITNSTHPIETPEDLEGVNIRVQENEIHLAAFDALGAQPSPMAWDEAITGLQQGVVDAQENPVVIADTNSLYDSNQHYMTLTNHVYSVAVYMMSQQTYDELPEDLRDIVLEEGARIGEYQRELMVEMEKESLANVQEDGMEIIEEVDTEAFQEIVSPVYELIEHQDLLQRIIDSQ